MADFCAFWLKTNRNWNVFENFEIYIYKSQRKIHFLSIFYPIFPDLYHFIQLGKITPFFYNIFFGFGGAHSGAHAHWEQKCLTHNFRVLSYFHRLLRYIDVCIRGKLSGEEMLGHDFLHMCKALFHLNLYQVNIGEFKNCTENANNKIACHF